VVPGPPAARLPAGAQPARRPHQLAGRIHQPPRYRAHRLHHHGCLPARLRLRAGEPLPGCATTPAIPWSGAKAISHYQRLGIDPAEKTLVFSDGLNLDKAVELFRHFRGRINTSFGIGTKLTCDLPGVSPMNIVFKLMECNGGPVAKISDSPGKTLCRDADFIRNLKQAFHVGV
jgi:hypothetical protein